ncbi:MAG: replication restart helicase PriA [Patescibacteria group bacterium]
MKYFQIIPLIKISLKREPWFTYKFEKDLGFGDLVLIDFKNKPVKGVVVKETRKPAFFAKKIQKRLKKNLISPKQYALAEKISASYFTPMGVTLKLFTFNLTQKKQPPDLSTQTLKKLSIRPTPKQSEAIKKTSGQKRGGFLLYGPASSGKTETIIKIAEKFINKKKQVLILLPEIFLSYQELKRYQNRIKKGRIALLHSELKPSEISFIWENVKKGEIDVLLTTKMGLFLQFKNLGLIVVEEEQESSYKQWNKKPAYHAVDIAQKLSNAHKTGLILSSATPSADSYQKYLEKKLTLLRLPMLRKKYKKALKPEIVLADLKSLYVKNNRKGFYLSPQLMEAFKSALHRKKTGIIMVPNRGKSSAVMCSDCKKILKCPKCSFTLINSGDKIKCLHCSYKTSSLAQCPQCKSFRLINLGFGTESIAEELQQLFPEARIACVDNGVFAKKGERERIFKLFYEGKLDFLVGTQAISKSFDLEKIEFAGVINADKQMGKTDFRFDEKWLGSLFQLAGRINRPGKSFNKAGQVIIQTYQPNNKFFEHLKRWDWENYLREELEKRKSLKYPPFGHFYKITYTAPLSTSKQLFDKKTKKVYNDIANAIKELEGFEILDPQANKSPGKFKKSVQAFLLKTPCLLDFEELFKKDHSKKFLYNYLINISDEWEIDPSPEKFF